MHLHVLRHVCVFVRFTCSIENAIDNHLARVRCHAYHAVDANKQLHMSADRQTDLGTAVYKCE